MPSEVPGFQHFIQHKLTILLTQRNDKSRSRHTEHLLHDIHAPLQTSIIPTPSTPPVPLLIAAEKAEEDCTAVAETPSHSEVVSPIIPRRSYPAKYGEGFDAPPTL